MKLSDMNPATMPGPGDFHPPSYYEEDEPECPECGGEMEMTGSGTWGGRSWSNWTCCDEDCDGTVDGEPDWEDVAASRADY
jgi:hypothetical protein